MTDFFLDYTLRVVLLGSAVIGAVSGALGAFAVLRRQSLLGDTISHAALPGVALAFLLTRSKAPLPLLVGAALAGWLGTLLVMTIVRSTRVKEDTAQALVLAVLFGLGMVLLTYIQQANVADASQAGLRDFLFGQAATLLKREVLVMAGVGLAAVVVLLAGWKEFKLASFDPDYAASLGLPVRLLEVVLTGLLVVAIVLGLQAAGVVLMSALVVAPASAARQWTDRLGVMVLLSALFGMAAGVSGAVLSSAAQLPTGPAVVVCLSALVFASLLAAPNRGLLWERVRHWRNRRRLQLEAVLADLHALAAQHDRPGHAHPAAVLQAMSPDRDGVRRTLDELAERGWVRRDGPDSWALTPEGLAEAERQARSRGNGHE